jgi:hypothetical protein
MTNPVKPDSDRKGFQDYTLQKTNTLRRCGLDPQSSPIRREASRLYISGDSDLRQNDGYGYSYGDSDFRQNDAYRYTKEMSRKGLNMYNPLQAERSWGYRITTTLSELRSSSICYHSNHINHSSDNKGKGNKTQTYDAFIAETRGIASHGVYCIDGIDDVGTYIVETRGFASHAVEGVEGINTANAAYNVYGLETRSIASLHNIRQNINLQKSHGFDGTDAVETRCLASHHASLFPSLRGTKQSSVSCFWIASYLAMTNPVKPDSDRRMGYDLQTRSIASLRLTIKHKKKWNTVAITRSK